MKLDLRLRCKRIACRKLIRPHKNAKASYERYKPFCCYSCQEWDKLEMASDYIATVPGYLKGKP